ncbi:uncharacterized protein LOC113272837 [Papaver somniferum]|uniref:uncharacterized protein LOC113272837 n=1 Tax=Papaver somniferum TaxID=3469 RepID=UPI000E6F8F10|nr:uncharacterized protein LOC113272837 [Papaver somniferum]
MWFLHPDCMRRVHDICNAPLVESLAYVFPQKLKRLKADMKIWNQLVFGNVYVRLKQAQLRLESALRVADEDPSDLHKHNLMKEATVEVSDVRMQLETMLKQKSRNKWLVDEDSNTSFFHNTIRIRMSSNTISELIDDNGDTITDCDQIKDLAVNYFENNGDASVPVNSLFDIDHPIISVEESNHMDHLPSIEEIHEVVFNLGADSAPGPDGFTGFFYRHCWEIIREDLVSASIFCWFNKFVLHGVNSSLLLLFPKERAANTLRNFRSIWLSNFFFKIFTKILAARLGSVLGNLVSEEQVAFMKGKNIHENISFALEMVNELQIKRKDGNVGLKLDITQDFDTVS